MTQLKKLGAAIAGLLAPVAASASLSTGTAIAQNSFDNFAQSILSWIQGPLGIGLALVALVIGGGAGIMKSSPMTALSGVGMAAFFAWGPDIIIQMVNDGSGALV